MRPDPQLIMQRWNVIQYELLPELRSELGTLTPKLEKGQSHDPKIFDVTRANGREGCWNVRTI